MEAVFILSGYYTIASGLTANQKNIDIISNNLLNSETVGFYAEKGVFSAFEMEMMTISDSGGKTVLGDGIGSPAVTLGSQQTLFLPGTIQSTDRSLDVAINGQGFFNITGEDGKTYLTRNGGFSVDTEGYLTLPGIGRVLGTNGYIQAAGSNITISADGTVSNSKGVSLGKMLISAPSDYTTLERTEKGMFTTAGATPVSTNYKLVQNSLEQSNVNTNSEYVNLIAAQRAFQSCSSALSTIDGINRKAAQQIAAI